MKIDDLILRMRQDDILERADIGYEKMNNGMLSRVDPKFAALHDVYTDFAAQMGNIIMLSLDKPEWMTQEEYDLGVSYRNMIAGQGGSVAFDREVGAGLLERWVGQYMTREERALISDEVWEMHILSQSRDVIQAVKKARKLVDNERNDERIGMTREMLLDTSAFVQAFMIHRELGPEYVKILMPDLREGMVIYS